MEGVACFGPLNDVFPSLCGIDGACLALRSQSFWILAFGQSPDRRSRPLAGRSRGTDVPVRISLFSFFNSRIAIPDYAPLFSISSVSDSRSAPVTHQDQGDKEFLREEIFPPLARSLAPENCRYHAASKVMRITDPMALPVRGPTHCGSRRGRTIESQHHRVVYI
jgi:hypothetical protein